MEKKLEKLSIYNLWLFTEVIRFGSMNGAAKHLGIPVSSVSYDIRGIEKIIDTALFSVVGKRIILTESGKKLSDYAQEIICKFKETDLIKTKKESEKETLEIVLATTHMLCDFFMAEFVEKIHEQLPNLNIKILSGYEHLDFLTNTCDVVIGPKTINRPFLSQIFMREFNYSWYANDIYLKKHGFPKNLEDLENHKLLFFDKNDMEKQATHLHKGIFCESGAYRTLIDLANKGLGIIPIAQEILHHFLGESEKRFTQIFPDTFCEKESYYFVFRRNSPKLEVIRKVRDICIALLATQDEYKHNPKEQIALSLVENF